MRGHHRRPPTIVSADIATDTITASNIAAGAVGSLRASDNSIASADILDGTIASVDIGTDVMHRGQHRRGRGHHHRRSSMARSPAPTSAPDVITAATSPRGPLSARPRILDGTIATADIGQSVWSGSCACRRHTGRAPGGAAGNAGYLYYATDDDTLWRSDGATWVKVSTGGTVVSSEITDGTIASADIGTDVITAGNESPPAASRALRSSTTRSPRPTSSTARSPVWTCTAGAVTSGKIGSGGRGLDRDRRRLDRRG